MKNMKWLATFSIGMLVGCFLTVTAISFAATDHSPVDVDELRRFTESFAILKSNQVDSPTDRRLIDGCLTGMAQGLDPATEYVDREAWREMRAGQAGKLGGIGIEIRLEDGFAVVVAPMDGSPAARAGVQAGDIIVQIDGKAVRNIPLAEVARLLRGETGSDVSLALARQGTKGLIAIPMQREIIRPYPVKLRMLDGGIVVVRLPALRESTVEELVEQIRTVQQPLAGLILDLRNNAGGAVKSAVGIAAVFLKPFDKVASFEGNVGGGKSTLSAIPDDYRMASWPGDILQTLPASVKTTRMVVLVNRGTSAGAEIVGGALQDHRRAVIVGKQTFGNTSVQVMFPLKSDDGLKVTTARWLTPNGRSLASKGLVPDINVDGPESRTGDAVGSDPQLDLALRMIRAK